MAGRGFLSQALVKMADKLHESYQTYVDQPEIQATGDCQKVDGRGWEDTKMSSSASANLYVDNISNIDCTKYHECD